MYRCLNARYLILIILVIFSSFSRSSAGVLFSENFESSTWANNWEFPNWAKDGTIERMVGHSSVKEGNASLRVKLTMSNGVIVNRVIRHNLKDRSHHHLFLRWYQMVESGPFFTASNNLAIKGNSMYGWIVGKPWPQNLDQNNPKFTLRASMRSGTGIYPYTYWGGIGNVGVTEYQNQGYDLNPNQWYCIETELKGNTIGQNNGEIRLWVDGTLRAQVTGLFLRGESNMKIQQIEDLFKIRPFGSLQNATVVQWRDAYAIGTERIGCSLSATPPSPPPPPSSSSTCSHE